MPAPETRDYFAELYVAGLFGDAGWAVYFPKRDVGFDFVVSKSIDGQMVLRPVQVKGLYPTAAKTDKNVYGFRGALTATHREMVLALPFFAARYKGAAPELIAYVPFWALKTPIAGGYRCQPARFTGGSILARPEYEKFFGEGGLQALASPTWSLPPPPAVADLQLPD